MTEDSSILRPLHTFVPSLRRASNRALSVYLPARAEGYDARHYDIELGQLRRRYRDRLDAEDREIMERELRRLGEHLEVVKPAGCPALAGFGDQPVGLLELVKLPSETEARLEVGPLLFAPIERQLERFPPALIAVVDKQHARLFAAVLDEVYPLEQVHGVEVKRNKAGGTSASSNQRKADNRTKSNLERVIDVIGHEVQSGSYRRIFIAGPEEARAELERLMPPPLKRVLAGHLSASIDSGRLQHELRQQLELARSH
ncbi:MAG: baeRF10 domain-containing protein [Candidatus Dormibacteraceae bacterium]